MQELYKDSLFAAWVLLTFFGCNMLLGKLPWKSAEGYGRSRKLLGIAFLCFAVQIFIQWRFEFREWNPMVASALNFSCFYMAAFLFGMSFISLLDAGYICKRRVITDICKYIVVMTMAWTAALTMEGTAAKMLMRTVALIFFIDTLSISVRFFKTYRHVMNDIDDYYADNIMAFVTWLFRSTYGIIIFGLSCTVMAFAPQWAIAVYMTIGIFMFIYIYLSFQNYIMHYGRVSRAINKASKTKTKEVFVL